MEGRKRFVAPRNIQNGVRNLRSSSFRIFVSFSHRFTNTYAASFREYNLRDPVSSVFSHSLLGEGITLVYTIHVSRRRIEKRIASISHDGENVQCATLWHVSRNSEENEIFLLLVFFFSFNRFAVDLGTRVNEKRAWWHRQKKLFLPTFEIKYSVWLCALACGVCVFM